MVKSSGVCRLTKDSGTFVRCHVIPKALSYSNSNHDTGNGEARFVEVMSNQQPKRALTSWFDPVLVTQKGEDILSRIDTWGIEILRRHSLLAQSGETIGSTPLRYLRIDNDDVLKLRNFLLSVLWRAAVSDMPQFEEIVLDSEDVEAIRCSIVDSSPLPSDDFPIYFKKIINLTDKFNTTPINDEQVIKNSRTGMNVSIPRFTFYFDGLFVFFGTKRGDARLFKALTSRALGGSSVLMVEEETYDLNQQFLLSEKVKQARQDWPIQFGRLVN